jgi:UDP-GlcNAc:undecaprenyl-phosphate/decaprenyl-phosphate GlcNAc-1-phosphate transferase
MANLLLLAICSFVLTLLLVPVIRGLAIRWGCVVRPTQARWHKRPTPTLGGVAVFAGCFLPALFFAPSPSSSLPLFLIASQMFVVGLYDDLCHLNPVTKLTGQLSAAATALFFGYSLQFATWPPIDAVLTVLWIVGLTNAVNLLDNMDGLAGGIGLIAALYLAFFFHQHQDQQHTWLALALAGAVAGFLVFNFHPASIFMGDVGSLFLGSTLSLLAIRAHGQASNIFSLVAVPTCLLLVPILDTGLVTLTRVLRGQSVSQGGKDHVSHRLVVLGLTEPQAVLCLYAMAATSGATTLWIEKLSYTLSSALLPLVVLTCVLFTAYLSQVEILPPEEGYRRAMARRLPAMLLTLTYKRRLLEVILDFCLMAFAYYLAFVLRFDFLLDAANTNRYLTSLPIVLIATSSAFFFVGVYRGVWRYTDLEDMVRLAIGVAGGTCLAAAVLLLLYGFTGYSRAVFVLYAMLLFLGIAGSRLSFRLFALLVIQPSVKGVPVLIYGAGDGGGVVVRECRRNPQIKYRPVGFLDDDPRKQGRLVQGLPVLGGAEKLADFLQRQKVQGLIISSPSILANGKAAVIRAMCEEREVWVKTLRLEFVERE